MNRWLGSLVAFLSSYGLAVVLLLWLFLLTLFGTLEHCNTELSLHAAQEKYFNSLFFRDFYLTLPYLDAFHIRFPLPGAQLALSLLFVNLIVGGLIRLRKRKSTVGILIAHVGIAILLAGGFVEFYMSDEGHMSLFEGERAHEFESHYYWQVSITRQLDDGRVRECVIPHEDLADMERGESRTFARDDLPFDLVLSNWMPHCEPSPKGPMFEVAVPVVDGFFLKQRPRELDAEFDVAGAYATVVEKASGRRHEGILWGSSYDPAASISTAARNPWVIDVDGVPWGIELLHERYPLPYTIHLDDFIHELHPRTMQDANFQSDVLKIDEHGEQPVVIRMNEPLRDQGHIVFQSTYGPRNARPGDRMYSGFSIQRNPSDQWPTIACAIIALGLGIHFVMRLRKHLRKAMGATS